MKSADPNWPRAGNIWFKIECIINTGQRYELVSPGILFRETLLFYMLIDRGVEMYKGTIAGTVIFPRPRGISGGTSPRQAGATA